MPAEACAPCVVPAPAPLLPIGIRAVGEELGGLPAGSLVHIHGPSSAGKTTLGLQLAGANRPAGLVLAERTHAARMRAIMGASATGLLVARPGGFKAQKAAVRKGAGLLARGRIQVLVLDSLSYLYRFEQLASKEAFRELLVQLHLLGQAAREGKGLAVFTNQVRGGPTGPRPLGGPAVEHASDVVLAASVIDGPWRRLRLEKHPFRAPGKAWDLRLGTAGFGPGT